MPRRRPPAAGAVARARLGPVAGVARGRGPARRGLALLPADAVAGELLERQAGVEGDGRGELGGGHRAGAHAEIEADALREVGEHAPLGADLADARDRRAQALQAPVGVRDGALLLGVRLGREDDGRVLAHGIGQELGVGDHRARAVQRALPQRAVRQRQQRIDVHQVQRGELAVGRRLRDRVRVAPGRRRRRSPARRRARRPPRAGRGRWPAVGIPSSPAPSRARTWQPPAIFSSACAAAPRRRAQQPLAPHDHDVLALPVALGVRSRSASARIASASGCASSPPYRAVASASRNATSSPGA